jgi:hypothetical protein
MGERKVLNNYISPDFDPSIIPKFKRNKDRIQEIRMMLPFSMQCNTCGEYLYRGKKFNSKKEDCKGEDYMGIRRFRFYIKCSVCSAEITFKTDPKNTDYECESGASRNFEVWRDVEEAKEAVAKEREEEDEHDTMKALENRTLDSKIEMDVLDALDEIKAINQRHERVDTAAALAALQRKSAPASAVLANGLTKEDEDLVKSIKFKSSGNGGISSDDQASLLSTKTKEYTGTESAFGGETNGSGGAASLLQKQLQSQAQAGQGATATAKPMILVKKRKADVTANGVPAKVANTSNSDGSKSATSQNANDSGAVKAPTANATAANSMFGDYGDSD